MSARPAIAIERRFLALVFLASLAAFVLAPVRQTTGDAAYTLVASTALLRERSLRLDPHVAGDEEAYRRGPRGLYQFFPPGSAILSTPAVVVAELFGASAVDANGRRDAHAELRIGEALAAVLMATFVTLVYATARLLLARAPSLAIAAVTALGTSVLSSLSRALWSQTWAVLLVGVAWYLVLADATGRRRLSAALLATVLAWAYFTRPTSVVPAIAICSTLLFRRRRVDLAIVAVVGLAWFSAFVLWSRSRYGASLPPYYQPQRLGHDSFREALLGNLVSPSRGLLVFTPVLLWVFGAAVVYAKRLKNKPFAAAAAMACVVHVALVASFVHWWGGASYGPRLSADLLPSAVVLAVIVVASAPVPRAVVPALCAFSIAMHVPGAVFPETWEWGSWIGWRVERRELWSISRSQVLAPWFDGRMPPPDDPPMLAEAIGFEDPNASDYVVSGFTNPEEGYRWTSYRNASLAFALPRDHLVDSTLAVRFTTYLAPPREPCQRVIATLNGTRVLERLVCDRSLQDVVVKVPASLLREKPNELAFEFPDARSTRELGIGLDPRRLGIALYAVELVPESR
ncbi:MAG: hypothetical protein ACXVEE_07385 [Polyangiales bacterium]